MFFQTELSKVLLNLKGCIEEGSAAVDQRHCSCREPEFPASTRWFTMTCNPAPGDRTLLAFAGPGDRTQLAFTGPCSHTHNPPHTQIIKNKCAGPHLPPNPRGASGTLGVSVFECLCYGDLQTYSNIKRIMEPEVCEEVGNKQSSRFSCWPPHCGFQDPRGCSRNGPNPFHSHNPK